MRHCIAVLLIGLSAMFAGCGMPPPFRVMTFNIRYGTADDGANSWPHRREHVLTTIRDYDPDILGLQEVLASQADELRAAFPKYGFVGVGRDDGERAGEFAPVMFRRSEFQLVRAGYFWLSERPERPGVLGWDAACPRLVTWVRLRCVRSPANEIQVINTHFDHRGERARLESARLIRKLVDSLAGTPIILMGDFNCGPGSDPYRALTAETGNLAELLDARVLLNQPETDTGTYHAFRGGRAGERIDWILHNRRFRPQAADIDQRQFDGRYPSDHFPVTATLELRAATKWRAF
jgi:endonuclease/exonuclease/phosphatase family metal-dependent hydrolase